MHSTCTPQPKSKSTYSKIHQPKTMFTRDSYYLYLQGQLNKFALYTHETASLIERVSQIQQLLKKHQQQLLRLDSSVKTLKVCSHERAVYPEGRGEGDRMEMRVRKLELMYGEIEREMGGWEDRGRVQDQYRSHGKHEEPTFKQHQNNSFTNQYEEAANKKLQKKMYDTDKLCRKLEKKLKSYIDQEMKQKIGQFELTKFQTEMKEYFVKKIDSLKKVFKRVTASDHTTERHAQSIAPKITETTLTSAQQRKIQEISSKRSKKHSEVQAATSSFLVSQPERLSFTLQAAPRQTSNDKLPNRSEVKLLLRQMKEAQETRNLRKIKKHTSKSRSKSRSKSDISERKANRSVNSIDISRQKSKSKEKDVKKLKNKNIQSNITSKKVKKSKSKSKDVSKSKSKSKSKSRSKTKSVSRMSSQQITNRHRNPSHLEPSPQRKKFLQKTIHSKKQFQKTTRH